MASYLVNGVVDAWTESAMYTEDAIVHDGCQREVVEYISAVAPDIE